MSGNEDTSLSVMPDFVVNPVEVALICGVFSGRNSHISFLYL